MGFSGIAATNAGLALLGGGSLAMGGFGMLGGAAVLTAALTFSTSVVFDYSVGKAVASYDYKRMSEDSARMFNLPLPRNGSGPPSVKAAFEIIDDLHDEHERKVKTAEKAAKKAQKKTGEDGAGVIDLAAMRRDWNEPLKRARSELVRLRKPDAPAKDRLREESLLALLHFLLNEHRDAEAASRRAISLARELDEKATLPAFILATSLTYRPKLDREAIFENIRYAVNREEPKVQPILWAVFLDRIMYRANDLAVTPDYLARLYAIADPIQPAKVDAAIQTGFVSRSFQWLKLEQQRVLSLATTENTTLQCDSKTVATMKSSIARYRALAGHLSGSLDRQGQVADAAIDGKLFEPGDKSWQKEWKSKVGERTRLLGQYREGLPHLQQQVRKFEVRQTALREGGQCGAV